MNKEYEFAAIGYLRELWSFAESSHVWIIALDKLCEAFLNCGVANFELGVTSVLIVLTQGLDYFVTSL